MSEEAAECFNNLEDALKGVKHSFHYTQNDDIVGGINEFVLSHQIDMVVMIPRTHNIFHNIFAEPKTKRLAFHTEIPLLTIHE